MAYMSQENKKGLAPWIKKVLEKYGMKWTLKVQHHSTLICNVMSWAIDFREYMRDGDEYVSVNNYHIQNHYEWKAKDFLLELRSAMMIWNHDNSDIMTDYFDVGWYIDINIWKWNKEYNLIK